MEGRSDRRVLMGVISAAHGVRGEVRIRSFCTRPADIAAYGPLSDEAGARSLAVRPVGLSSKGEVIARIEGVGDRTTADSLRGTRLYAQRAALPPPSADEWYEGDLVGLVASGSDGQRWGRVLAVHDFGAGALLELADEKGETFMVPFNDTSVPSIDVEAGTIVVDPPSGLRDGSARDRPSTAHTGGH